MGGWSNYHNKTWGGEMKSASELVKRGLVGKQANYQIPSAAKVKITPQAVMVMDKLFDELTAICTAWHKTLPSDQSVANFKSIWIEEIINANIRNWNVLVFGIERCKREKSPFLPSLGQFIEWCKEGELESKGIPSVEELLERIKQYSRFHGFDNQHEFQFKNNVEQYLIFDLYCRNKEFGWSAEELRKHAKSFLKATAEKLARGEELPELALALPEKASFISPEEQKKINLNGIALARAALKGDF